MITHDGKYLLHATHHGMRIYAATMGGKMVFGSRWLLPLTLQAIVAAFGAEDTEVIRKTNDYLNRIATTDPQRAQALAMFINEDPLLVCSLVETSKVRYLDSDGYAKIDLGITWAQANYQCDVEFTFLKVTKSGFLFGTQVWSGRTLLVHANANGTPTMYANTTKVATQNEDGTTTVKLVNTSGYTDSGSNSVCLMGFCSGHVVASSWREFKGTIGTNAYNLVPFNGADRIGMLDLDTFQFYPNANTEGAFTIQLTDKTQA